MKINSVVLNLFLFALPLLSFAQEEVNIDSLLQVYNKLPNDTTKVNLLDDVFNYYRKNDTSKLREFAKKQYALSKGIDYQKGIGKSYHNYARYYYQKNQMDSAKVYYSQALKKFEETHFIKGQADARWDLALLTGMVEGSDKTLKMIKSNIEFYKKIKDSNLLARTYHNEANLHFSNDNYKLALHQILKALKYFERTQDTLMLSNMYRTTSMIECELNHNEKALEYALKSLELAKQKHGENYEYYQVGMYNTIGIIYTQQKDFEKVDSIFNKAYAMAKELDWWYMQKLALYNHGKSYEDREDYTSALEKAKIYIEIEKKFPDENKSSLGQLGMGRALLNLKRSKKAKTYLDMAVTLSKKENIKRRMILSYENRAEANAQLNNYREAYEDHKMYAMLQDSVFNETKSQQIEEMRAIFDTEKKEQQIAQQEIEINLLEEQEKVSSLQKMILGGGLGLSLLALGFGFYGFRQRTKRARVEKEKVEAELAFKKKELTTHALHLAKKNEVLEQVKQKAKELKSTENIEKGYRQLVQTINFDQQDDKAWENFTQYFEAVHKDFAKQIVEKYPEISKNELRLMALIKMNMSSKEIANILNISSDGVKKARQRLRKKMELSPEDSLETTVMSI